MSVSFIDRAHAIDDRSRTSPFARLLELSTLHYKVICVKPRPEPAGAV